jgi:hypothetical protein
MLFVKLNFLIDFAVLDSDFLFDVVDVVVGIVVIAAVSGSQRIYMSSLPAWYAHTSHSNTVTSTTTDIAASATAAATTTTTTTTTTTVNAYSHGHSHHPASLLRCAIHL